MILYKKKRPKGKENKVPKLDIVISHTLGNKVSAKLRIKMQSLSQEINIQVQYYLILLHERHFCQGHSEGL